VDSITFRLAKGRYAKWSGIHLKWLTVSTDANPHKEMVEDVALLHPIIVSYLSHKRTTSWKDNLFPKQSWTPLLSASKGPTSDRRTFKVTNCMHWRPSTFLSLSRKDCMMVKKKSVVYIVLKFFDKMFFFFTTIKQYSAQFAISKIFQELRDLLWKDSSIVAHGRWPFCSINGKEHKKCCSSS